MSVLSYSKQHPFRLVGLLEVSVVAVFLAVFLILRRFVSALDASDIDLLLDGIAYSMLAVATAVLLTRLHWWRAAGFQRPGRWSFLLLFWLPLLPLALNLAGGLKTAPVESWRIGIFLIVSLLVGFVEEGIFRELMIRALYPNGIWTAAVGSSLLFGLAHSVTDC